MKYHDNKPISMIRGYLEDIPQYVFPIPVRIEWYQQGYEILWENIQKQADRFNPITPDLFDHEFGNDLRLLFERQRYLFDADGIAIGTGTAWFNNNYNGQEYGRLHWIAIVPKMEGKGLAKPLMTTVCNRLKELHHTRAYLTTSAERIPAINLYLKFGFVPEIKKIQMFVYGAKLGNYLEKN